MKKLIILLIISFGILSCTKEFVNHNNVKEDILFSKPEAYQAIVLGMTKDFATKSLYRIIHAPSFTAKENGNLRTYETEYQLVDGGPELTGINSSISGIWRELHRNRGIAEKIINRIDKLEFVNADAETDFQTKKSAYKAYAYLFRGMTTGYLSQYWKQVTTENNLDDNANFVSREDGYQKAIFFLDQALAELNNNIDAINYINNLVSPEFSIVDIIHALKARYYIDLGEYQNAYNEADMVDLTKRSVWYYESGSILNPIYANTIKVGRTRRFSPLEHLGLVGTQAPDNNDMRVPFYLDSSVSKNDNCGNVTYYPAGFWDADNKPIPVYLPGEMLLIKAESKARTNQLADAVALINEVRTKTPADDVFGVGASLGPWTGDATNQQDVLDEIYKNYAIELFMQGQRWSIHRRFYPNYLDNIDWNNVSRCNLERVNNFYPYPDQERANNPNCPPDPAY